MRCSEPGESVNINTKDYWDNRFASGDWEANHGREQTQYFARALARRLPASEDFEGAILDFGCGLGDAIPIYRFCFPSAKLIGMDLSQKAVESARDRYGDMADFIQGDCASVPSVDVIVVSNVLEHLADDIAVAGALLQKCTDLCILVPYREYLRPGAEHVNSYTKAHFKSLGEYRCSIFPLPTWSQYGYDLWINIYLKNVFRALLGKRTLLRSRQILFHFHNGKR